MARSLRDALSAKALPTTYSESLELIAKAFGYDNWNILAAKIDAAQPRADVQKSTGHGNLLYCSFCGKNQHEVRKLVAGPAVYICDECVDLCTDIVDDQLLRLIKGDEDSARAMSSGCCTMWSTLTGWCSVVVQRYSVSRECLRFGRTQGQQMTRNWRRQASLS